MLSVLCCADCRSNKSGQQGWLYIGTRFTGLCLFASAWSRMPRIRVLGFSFITLLIQLSFARRGALICGRKWLRTETSCHWKQEQHTHLLAGRSWATAIDATFSRVLSKLLQEKENNDLMEVRSRVLYSLLHRRSTRRRAVRPACTAQLQSPRSLCSHCTPTLPYRLCPKQGSIAATT